ncbi:MAG: hypothetical protein WCP21_07385, partial [Armatimonadota bacterium]
VRLRGEKAGEARRELLLLLLKQESPRLLSLLGSSFAREGKVEDAAGCFDRALQLDGEHVPTLVAMAQLQAGSGRSGAAAALLQKAGAAATTADERELVAEAQRRLSAGASPTLDIATGWWRAHGVSVLLALAYVLFLVAPALVGVIRPRL